MGAVLIDGPKAVGKTRTAEQVARTVFQMDVDRAARTAVQVMPEQLFSQPAPVVFDEWQETPELWNLVRRAVGDREGKGLYILTSSSRPRDNTRMHSGAGRIARLRMRPMSLFETGHSTGEVSLARLMDGDAPTGNGSGLSADELLQRMVIGGWPALLDADERDAFLWLRNYLRTVAEVDVPGLGPRRNPGNVERLLAALGRDAATPLNRSSLALDVGGSSGPLATETLNNYLDALERLMLIESVPAWRPHMRSRTRLRASAVHHFVDPSLGLAALGVGVNQLRQDLPAAGLHFESMVMRDLRVYTQPLGGGLSSWRDSQTGLEVDAVLELPDGRWAGIEVKLGEAAADKAADSLLRMAEKIDQDRHGAPSALIVLTGGRFAYRRPDGVSVVSITALGP